MSLDDSGMDFRAMLKRKKYAKEEAEEEKPDWGTLKHVEEEVPPEEPKKVKKVQAKSQGAVEDKMGHFYRR